MRLSLVTLALFGALVAWAVLLSGCSVFARAL